MGSVLLVIAYFSMWYLSAYLFVQVVKLIWLILKLNLSVKGDKWKF